MKPSVLISGPQACGKSHHAEALAKHFGCSSINHEWMPGQSIPEGQLALTWKTPSFAKIPSGTLVLDFYDAMRRAGLTPNSPLVNENGKWRRKNA